MAVTAVRTKVINLRTDEARRELIGRAAAALGKDRTEFMLDAAKREAQSVLLERRLFQLDDATFRRFVEALDAAPVDNPRLRRLLATPAPWERWAYQSARPSTSTVRERMKAIDEEYLYLVVQRIPSHAVHGSWVDLLLHHLDEHGGGFAPDSQWSQWTLEC